MIKSTSCYVLVFCLRLFFAFLISLPLSRSLEGSFFLPVTVYRTTKTGTAKYTLYLDSSLLGFVAVAS